MRFKWAFAWLICAVLASTTFAQDPGRVLIISIDGCRPDVALRADMPNLRTLMREGSFSFWATTTPAAITLPSHTSMLTGVTIERHGITGNDDRAAATESLRVPTIFDLAHQAGISTGMSAAKGKFSLFAKSIDHAWFPTSSAAGHGSGGDIKKGARGSGTSVAADQDVADHAVEILKDYQPRLMFLHFGRNDTIGHTIGWGTPQQIEGLAGTDRQLGRVLDELRALHLYDQTTIILSADHGGTGHWHGPNEERARFIPWIIRGPGIRQNFDLTTLRELRIQTYDTFATACDVLHLKPAADIDGKVIWQAYANHELFKASTTQRSSTDSKDATFVVVHVKEPVVQPAPHVDSNSSRFKFDTTQSTSGPRSSNPSTRP